MFDDDENLSEHGDELFLWEYCKDENVWFDKKTKEAPIALHFPGKNIRSYNICGEKLFGDKGLFNRMSGDNDSTPQKMRKLLQMYIVKVICLLVMMFGLLFLIHFLWSL